MYCSLSWLQICGYPIASQVLDYGHIIPCLALCSPTFPLHPSKLKHYLRIDLLPSFHIITHYPTETQAENVITVLGSPSSLWYSFYSVSSLGKYLNIPIDVQLLPLLVSLRAVKVNHYLNSLYIVVLVGCLCSSQLTDGASCPIKLLKYIEPKQVPVSWPEACHTHPTTHGILRFKAGLFQDDS